MIHITMILSLITQSIMALSTTTLNITELSITLHYGAIAALSKMTQRILKLIIVVLSRMTLNMIATLSIN